MPSITTISLTTLTDFLSNHLVPLMPGHPLYPPPGTLCPICTDPLNNTHIPILIANIKGCENHTFGYQCLRKVISCGQVHAKKCPLCRTPWFQASGSELASVKQNWERVDANEARYGNGVVHEKVRKESKWRDAAQARILVSWQAGTAWIGALYRMVPHVSWEYSLSGADEELLSSFIGSLCSIVIGLECFRSGHKQMVGLDFAVSSLCGLVVGFVCTWVVSLIFKIARGVFYLLRKRQASMRRM